MSARFVLTSRTEYVEQYVIEAKDEAAAERLFAMGFLPEPAVREFRSRELISAMLVFSLLVILIFNFALQLDVAARRSVTAGVLWATFTFAGTLGLSRSMALEKDRGCLDALLLAPVDRSAIYFGKMFSNLVFMLGNQQRLAQDGGPLEDPVQAAVLGVVSIELGCS